MKRVSVASTIILTFNDLDDDATNDEIDQKIMEAEMKLNELGDHYMGETYGRFHFQKLTDG